jgi:deazaflavin-dependent oxidoreductase (nitroreductase family)
MAYLKPPLFTQRVFNPLAMRFGIGGAATLIVAGRRTGVKQRVPVIPVEVGERRYIVSTRGESAWTRNLRAAGRGQLQRKGRLEGFRAAEIPVDERAPIIEAYKAAAGGVVASYFKTLPDPKDHPVFRIEPEGA